MYFATGELMGTPFGDLIPIRPEERIYFTVCHLTAGFVNAYLVGGMVAAITALNARNQSFYNSMDILNRFLTEKRLNARNPRLCERLRSYYIFRHNEGDGDGWKDIVLRTSREMQGEVVQELHSEWLRRVHYFSGVDADGNEWEVDDEFKLQLSLSMSVEVVAPMETVFKEDSPIDQLYVIQQGVVGCKGHVLKKGDPFGEDVLVYYSPEVLDEQEFRTRYGARWVCRPNGRGYRATAMTNVLLLAFPGDAIHELLDRPKYEYIKRQVRRKMFVWQVRHVMLTMYRALTEAVAADTYADGMQVLLQQYGFEMMQNVPTINERYMIMREAKGDDEVKVMRLFRKMWNRKRFIAAVEGLVRKRRRERALVEVRDELRQNVLKPVGAETYANALVAQGVTTRTVRDFSAMELVTSGLPVVLAKRVYKAARNLPETDVSHVGADGVAVDSRFVAGKGCIAELERLDAEAKKKKRELMRSLLYADETTTTTTTGTGTGRGPRRRRRRCRCPGDRCTAADRSWRNATAGGEAEAAAGGAPPAPSLGRRRATSCTDRRGERWDDLDVATSVKDGPIKHRRACARKPCPSRRSPVNHAFVLVPAWPSRVSVAATERGGNEIPHAERLEWSLHARAPRSSDRVGTSRPPSRALGDTARLVRLPSRSSSRPARPKQGVSGHQIRTSAPVIFSAREKRWGARRWRSRTSRRTSTTRTSTTSSP